MLIDEEEGKGTPEVNPDALEAVFAEAETLDDEEVPLFDEDDEREDEIDIAFLANDEQYW